MRKIFLLILLALVISGCAAGLDYQTLGNHMRSGNCAAAVEYLEKNRRSYGMNAELIYLMDSAMVNMMCRKYEQSNQYLHRAEELAQKLWTRSLTLAAASFLLNDYTKPYAGEDFEKALINLFSSLNYLQSGKFQDALVECRRLDTLLTALNAKYDEKNVYKEDAFGRYISGMLYEADRNPDEAYIDYFKSFHAYQDYGKYYGTPMPRILLQDLFRLADETKRGDEIRHLFRKYRHVKYLKKRDVQKLGKVVLIHFKGKSPVKVEDKTIINTRNGIITLAFPRYVTTAPRCRQSTVIAQTGSIRKQAKTELVEDINKIAVKNLEDRKARVIVKTIARAAVRRAVTDELAKNELQRGLLNFASILIERADTRTWRTLPGEIYVSRIFLPPGKHDIFVDECGWGARPVQTVSLKAGETRFILYESLY